MNCARIFHYSIVAQYLIWFSPTSLTVDLGWVCEAGGQGRYIWLSQAIASRTQISGSLLLEAVVWRATAWRALRISAWV